MKDQVKNEKPESTKRLKSNETVLKLKMRSIERDLTAIDKKITDFETLSENHAGNLKKEDQLKEQLTKVKQDLIKELGLE